MLEKYEKKMAEILKEEKGIEAYGKTFEELYKLFEENCLLDRYPHLEAAKAVAFGNHFSEKGKRVTLKTLYGDIFTPVS